MGCLPEDIGLNTVDWMQGVYSDKSCHKNGPTGRVLKTIGITE